MLGGAAPAPDSRAPGVLLAVPEGGYLQIGESRFTPGEVVGGAEAADRAATWRIGLDKLAEQLPLAQRYPSHLQRVLQPAHDMLVEHGILRNAAIRQQQREWYVDYMLGSRPA